MTMRKGLPAKLALTDADDTRYLFSGLVVCNTDGTPRGGVLSPVGENLVTATGTMNVSVKRFQGAAVRDAGVVLLANDGPTNVLLDAAPASNKRLDVVYAKQNDASGTVAVPDGDNLPVLGVAKGTAGPVPVKPAIPAGALELAIVEIPSTATATNSSGVVITQSARFTAAAGGVVPFRMKAELDLWTTASPFQRALVLATGDEYVRDGAAWALSGGDQLLVSQAFTGVPSVSVSGLTGFDSYEFEIQVTGTSAANDVSLRLRSGGSDNSAASYDRLRLSAAGAASVVAEAYAATSWDSLIFSPRDAYVLKGTIFGLSSARQTMASLKIIAALSTSSMLMLDWMLRHRAATAFDGLTLIASAGTITGTIKVTGKRS